MRHPWRPRAWGLGLKPCVGGDPQWPDDHNTLGWAARSHLSRSWSVVVDAALDWREWTDQQGSKGEAVTFRARHVRFEGGRTSAAVV
ncbi:MAG: hypothetical protein ACXVUE_15415 [Solirubrobacteraceae bacterium]